MVNKLLEFGISVYFLNHSLAPKFLIGNQLEGNFLLRQKQYSFDKELDISKLIVKNKAENQLILLKSIRNKDAKTKQGINKIKSTISKIDAVTNQDSLRGYEGNVSKIFFDIYFQDMNWYKRMPRTKIDPANLLMDIGYTFLYNFLESNLNLYGFDIYKGFYHQMFFQRKSLVCDLVEPFRCIIDKQIVKMNNLNQINEKDFKFGKGEYWLPWDKRNHYVKLLLEPILENKEGIFKFSKSYYRAFVKDDLNELEYFYI
ncbi:CRISPR-associated endonuclease Cas1 [Candidatus Absconditicoccus praedator]|uniref:CRISPR-associated endonuclease Cas1 n=1 Tax=Candidatus Absconditicoccus praedator TaxID=2735562 RepID=UPI001E4A986B|nr:CRISPR-associated endonuclease Cas1 [Candidatus Absconditicoccus praedator]UFX82656.1 CRISPR-associated endonuclease Cas1 [Candidatus Absconditicoccus praedator]